MTRIISGFAGSLPLTVPKTGTRPTSDRVREAIFSALDARGALDGARVLDLYAGSGALGLEAASRGASQVTLVEKAPAAAKIIAANAERVRRAAPRGEEPTITVVTQTVVSFATGTTSFVDLVFVDPPYELPAAELMAELAPLVPRLAPDALLILERATRDPEPTWPAGLACERRSTYGDTAVFWVRPEPQA
ncbi:MAG TPA: 16S rRNA (guanine(966)-N(2))-methyltransferase RsmD [Pseudolysinimonas sp.]|nr:16S rRNA (guanine(966)-N(2))-methyltransferase RsmD [Pseudolysinimonas sp.]